MCYLGEAASLIFVLDDIWQGSGRSSSSLHMWHFSTSYSSWATRRWGLARRPASSETILLLLALPRPLQLVLLPLQQSPTCAVCLCPQVWHLLPAPAASTGVHPEDAGEAA